MISYLMEVLVDKTIGLTLLTLIILCVRPLVLRYLNANVAYSMWLMLPLFLILPSSLIEQTVSSPVMTFFPESNLFLSSIKTNHILSNSGFTLGISVVWLVGLLLSIGLYFSRYRKLNASLNDSNYQLPRQQLTHKANFKIHLIEIKNTPLVNVPAVFGLFKSFLILPQSFIELSEEKQLMILRHEFYHLARHDHRVNFFRVLVKSLFWFNPLFYWADRVVEADQEISCDLGVLKNSPQTEKKNYARVLIESVSGINQNYLVSQWKYQSLIKERIKMLKNTNQKQWHKWVAAGFAVASVWTTSLVIAGEKKETMDAVPVSVESPMYPKTALMDGTEGWVKLEFDLDKSGLPFNVAVVKSEPENIFDKDAMEALNKWKFKPKKVNGIAMEQYKMHYTMEFKLSDD